MTTVTIWNDETPFSQKRYGNKHSQKFVKGIQYKTVSTGENAAQEAFHCSNASEEILTSNEKILASYFNGHRSLSVGDVVDVDGIWYRCESFGWKIIENSSLFFNQICQSNSNMKNTPQFQEALTRFVSELNKMVENYRVEMNFTFVKAFGVTIDGGNKYIRISDTETLEDGTVKIKGVHCFIDSTNGNILKANSYKAPCLKNPRGNIFKENCLEGVSVHGVVYLKIQNAENEASINQLKQVAEAINSAKGFSVSVYFKLLPNVKEKLESLGYIIKYEQSIRGSEEFTLISF